MAADDFETFYRTYHEPVRRLARRLTGNPADADDVAQEVMLRAGRRGGVCEPAWPWLAVVTRRVVIDTHRRTQRVVPTDDDVLAALAGPAADDPSHAAVRADCRRRLSRALHRLSPGERELLTRRHVDEVGVAALAAAAGVSKDVLRQRLHRVRRRLDHFYRASGGEAPVVVPTAGDTAPPCERVTSWISAEVMRAAARCAPRPAAPSRPAAAAAAVLLGAVTFVATAPPAGDAAPPHPSPPAPRPTTAPPPAIGVPVERIDVDDTVSSARLPAIEVPRPAPSPPYPGKRLRWEQRELASSPPARHSGSMVYDEARGVTLLFGGSDGVTQLGDTSTWDGENWTELHSQDAPSPRSGAGIAYDAARRQVVLFGGATATGVVSDTWTWDGATWTELAPDDPPAARSHPSLAYDPAAQRVVLFGGHGAADDAPALARHAPSPAPSMPPLRDPFAFNDTWAWDGATWRNLRPASSPPLSDYAALSVLPETGHLVLVTGTEAHAYTWTWDGMNWLDTTVEDPWVQVPKSANLTLAYSPDMARIVAYVSRSDLSSARLAWEIPDWRGGIGARDPGFFVWGGFWRPLASFDAPRHRSNTMFVSDAGRDEFVLFGGLGGTGVLRDTWIGRVIPGPVDAREPWADLRVRVRPSPSWPAAPGQRPTGTQLRVPSR